jgi:hypothetical protein
MIGIYNKKPKTRLLEIFHKNYEPLMDQILMWGWEVYRLQGNMIAYFSEAKQTEIVIFYTLNYLWKNRNTHHDKVYQFLNEIVEVVSSRPVIDFTYLYLNNINEFWTYNKDFFHYPTLLTKLNQTTRKNAYQILCFSMILFDC